MSQRRWTVKWNVSDAFLHAYAISQETIHDSTVAFVQEPMIAFLSLAVQNFESSNHMPRSMIKSSQQSASSGAGRSSHPSGVTKDLEDSDEEYRNRRGFIY